MPDTSHPRSPAGTTVPRTGVAATPGWTHTDAPTGLPATTPPVAPAAARTSRKEEPSLGDMVGKISHDLSTLVRQEADLAKAEMKQSAQRAGKGAGMFGGAGIAGHLVLVFLSVALWAWLASLLGGGWAGLIVAGVWAIVAAVLALVGRSEIRAIDGIPQTTDSVKKIPQALRGHEEKNS